MDNSRYYDKYNINIDSQLIKKNNNQTLNKINLKFIKNTNKIYCDNINDYYQVQLKGFKPLNTILNIYDDNDKCIIETFNSKYVKINYKHKIKNVKSDLHISLEGILGKFSKYFNKKHKIYLEVDDYNYSSEYFFIKLPFVLNNFDVDNDYLFTLHKHYIGGINIDLLNSIKYLCHDNILELPSILTIQYDETINLNLSIIPYINYYSTDIYNLGKTYNNIQSLKLTSSEFPNLKNYILINNNNNIDNIILFKYLSNTILILIPCKFYSIQEFSELITNTINDNIDDDYIFNCKIVNKKTRYIKFYLFKKCCKDSNNQNIYLDSNNQNIYLDSNNQNIYQDSNNQDKYIFIDTKYKKLNNNIENVDTIYTLVPCKFESDILQTPLLYKIKYHFKLYEYSYFYMCINQFNTFEYTGLNIKPFAKIQLGTNELTNNKTLFNTFINAIKTYISPIESTSILYIDFYDPKGNKIDFYNLAYSFSLELTSVFDLPSGTLVNPRTSQNYISKYDQLI